MNRNDLYNAFNDVDQKLVERSETGASFAGKARKRSSGSGKSGWNVLSPILVAVALIATLTVITVAVMKNRNNGSKRDPLVNVPTEGPSDEVNGNTSDPDQAGDPNAAASYFVAFRKSNGTVDYMLFFKNGDGSGRAEQYRLENAGGENRLANYETVAKGEKLGEARVSANVMRTVAELIGNDASIMAFDAHGSELPSDSVSFATKDNDFSVMISSGIYEETGDPKERNLLLSYYESWTGLANENMPEASIALLFAAKGVCSIPGAETGYRPGEGADRTIETVSLNHKDGTLAFVLSTSYDSECPGYILTLAADNFGFELYRCFESPYLYFSDDNSIRAERLISVNNNPSLLPLVQLLLASKRTETFENDQIVFFNSGNTPGMYKRIMMLAVLYDVDGYIDGQFNVAGLFRAVNDPADDPTPTLTPTATAVPKTPGPTDPPHTEPPHTEPPVTPESEEEMIELAKKALSSEYPEFAGLPFDRMNVIARHSSYNNGWYVRYYIMLGGKDLDWYYEYEYDGNRNKYSFTYYNGSYHPDQLPELCYPEALLSYDISADKMAQYEKSLVKQIKDQIEPGKLKDPGDLEEKISSYWEIKDGWICLSTEMIVYTVDPESFEYGCQGHAHLFGSVQVVDLSQF